MPTKSSETWQRFATLLKNDKVKIIEAPGVYSDRTYVVTDVIFRGGPLYELGGFHHTLPRNRLKKVAGKRS